jgi:hypothetical protein
MENVASQAIKKKSRIISSVIDNLYAREKKFTYMKKDQKSKNTEFFKPDAVVFNMEKAQVLGSNK